MKHLSIGLAAALLALPLCSAAATAIRPDPLTDCVDLSASHRGVRAGTNAQLLLKDGDAHYRVAFNGECHALARTSSIRFETAGQANRLCPMGSTVRAANSSCNVQAVERIEPEVYERRARMNRLR